MPIVPDLRADTHGDLMSVIEAVAAETAATNAAVAAAATAAAAEAAAASKAAAAHEAPPKPLPRRTSGAPSTCARPRVNIEALCAAPPEALTHSPSQMPLSDH